MQPAVFLDRDNTLIANDGDLGERDMVRLQGGVGIGLKALRDAGYRLVVVTNQAGVARGVFTEADVEAVHERIAALVDGESGLARTIDRFYYCPFHPEGVVEAYRRDHPWRKPRSGMLLQAAHDLGLDLSRSWMIGDQARDVLAGQSAGCRTILIGMAGSDGSADARPTATVPSFAEAVQAVLRGTPRARTGARPSAAERSDAAERVRAGAPAASALMARGTTEIKTRTAPAPISTAPHAAGEGDALRRAMSDLTDEMRSQRQRRAEFTALRMAAAFAQLLAVTAAVLALLQLDSFEAFVRWMLGALVLQLLAMTLLLADAR